MDTIITYEQAKAQGLKRFYTGRTCKNGHTDEQLVSSRECVGCKRARELRSHAADPTIHARQYQKNRMKRLIQQKIADDARREEKVGYGRKWRAENPEHARTYRKDNAGLYAWHSATRRKRVRLATPSWCEHEQIKELYLEAHRRFVATGVEHDVDHIIPLVNDLVCGLHCLANLQVLTSVENGQKKNRFSQPC